ncbi:MAG: uncharacterized protein PWQ41_780 [Bacillota bacterium]|nr:uncharacterized protein [Bacillota bacterium]MDK2925006.1 uncharacterized protein [Bacillota bacterium]
MPVDLVRIDLSRVYAQVVDVLSCFPEVIGAYHFGSSLDLCRPDSDIDIGVVLRPLFSFEEKKADKIQNEISNKLRPLDGHPFDVVVLNTLPSVLAFPIVKKGRLVYQADRAAILDFLEALSRRYGEDYPRYAAALKAIVGV